MPMTWILSIAVLCSSFAVGIPSAVAIAGPPAWFTAHLEYLTAGDGVWVADNAAYQSKDEPADQYEVTYVWGAGKRTASGTMRAITDGKRSRVIWDYRVFWDPGQKKVMLQQHGFWGSYGIGETRHIDAKTLRTEQTFYEPDGGKSRAAHDWILKGPRRHETRSFGLEKGEWKPGRSYLWERREVEKKVDKKDG